MIWGIFSLVVIILISSSYLSKSSYRHSPPVYEEKYSVGPNLNREISAIDSAIYESLYRRGVPPKNILFLAVKPKNERGYEWDFTKILIKLSKRRSIFELNKILDLELTGLRPVINFKIEELSNKELDYHIFARGFYTHQVKLKFKELKLKEYQETYPKNLPKIGIIIDDLGYDRDMATSFMQLDFPISFSVLPMAPYSKQIADKLKRKGLDIILHLPMEPKNYPLLDPGPGTLLTRMDERQIRRAIDGHLKRIPGVIGVNNHMGSSFTEKRDKVAILLNELKKRKLFFVDSITTRQTVAFSLAKKMGVPVAKRSVFLDNDLSPMAIKLQIERLLGIARHSGTAIGIGHPHGETLKVLKDYFIKIKNKAKVVHVSELVG